MLHTLPDSKEWLEKVKTNLCQKRALTLLLIVFVLCTGILMVALVVVILSSVSDSQTGQSGSEASLRKPTGVEFRGARQYFIQAEKVIWDYLPAGKNLADDNYAFIEDTLTNGVNRVGSKYSKYVYQSYTDDTFTKPIPKPRHQGFVGPIIKAEVGEIIHVYFRNRVDIPVSVHPHGVRYDKQNEGALYVDNSFNASADDAVNPGANFRYTWTVPAEFAPMSDDPSCVPFAYHSHVEPVKDINSGLLGPLLVCKQGTLTPTGLRSDVDKELVLYFDSIDEGQSWLAEENLDRCQDPAECRHFLQTEDPDFEESLKKDSINGYMFGNLPGLEVCADEKVVWYIFSLNAELHPVSIHGHTFDYQYHRTSVIGVWSATFVSATTVSNQAGSWMVSCMNAEHSRNGMRAFLTVKDCGEMMEMDESLQSSEESLEQAENPHLSGETRHYFFSAESEVWDYAESGLNKFDGGSLTGAGKLSAIYFTKSNNRIGGQYKKARFLEYEEISFSRKKNIPNKEKHLGILGPPIRAEVGDIIHVTLQNTLSHPVSIYLQGVSLDKRQDGLRSKEGKSSTYRSKMTAHLVKPGSIGNYTFTVPWSVSPGPDDPDCVSYMYYSAYDVERDISSGLVGPLLICRPGSISEITRRKGDRELFLFFSSIDENKSWYLDENVATYTDGKVDKNDQDFIESNKMEYLSLTAEELIQSLEDHLMRKTGCRSSQSEMR